MFEELVTRNRSFRRFRPEVRVPLATLRDLVALARLSPSAANAQPLKYVLSTDPETNGVIYSTLRWAGYLKGWEGPESSERPAAYVVILGDTLIRERIDCDHGIAAQTIMLGAVERGLGGCIFSSIDRSALREALELPEALQILLVLALGAPAETVVIEDLPPGGSIHYWRDDEQVHHVPKRSLEELIHRAVGV
jgi:nitroreductase